MLSTLRHTHNLFSIEFIEPGRAHSTMLDYPTLDAAKNSAESLLGANIASEVLSIMRWGRGFQQPDMEWAFLPDGVMTPLSFCSTAVH